MPSAFTQFMARIPAEYLPEVQQAITDAVSTLANPVPTGAEHQAILDRLQGLQEQIGADVAQAAAEEWVEVIEERLTSWWTERLIEQGMSPAEVAEKASRLVRPRVNDLLSYVESVRTTVQSGYVEPAARFAWVKVTALAAGAAGLLSFAVFTGVQRGGSAAGFAEDLRVDADAARQAQEFRAREREVAEALADIQVAGAEFDRMANLLTPPAVVEPRSVVAPPVTLQRAGPSPLSPPAVLPPVVAAQRVAVAVARPNQPMMHSQTTVGKFIAAMPSPQREETAAVVAEAARNAAQAPVSARGSRIPERHFTVRAIDGGGTIFGTYSQ
ncbi:MAG: hypothetical protein ACJ8GN_27370 [Longimicrobiaceae bacterium]